MKWLNDPSTYENMGECDFRGCTEYTPDPHCPYRISSCILLHLCVFSHTG